MWDAPKVDVRGPNCADRYQKERVRVLISGRWPWKLESARECVTTHLTNAVASKMDGAKHSPDRRIPSDVVSDRVGRAQAWIRRPRVNVAKLYSLPGADLGVISKYPGETPED